MTPLALERFIGTDDDLFIEVSDELSLPITRARLDTFDAAHQSLRSFPIGPSTYAGPRAEPHQAHRNAARLAISSGLTYCEGVIFIEGVPIEHAWCIDSEGVVVDLTYHQRRMLDLSYVGIPFSTEQVILTITRSGYGPMLTRGNPYHDKAGLFASGSGAAATSGGLDNGHVTVTKNDTVIAVSYEHTEAFTIPKGARKGEVMDQYVGTSKIEASLYPSRKEARIHTVFVDDSARRQGMATKLFNRLNAEVPADFVLTTSGVFSSDGKAFFEGLTKKGMATKTEDGNYILKRDR